VIPWIPGRPSSLPIPRYVPPAPKVARPCGDLHYAGTLGVNSVTDVYYLAVRNRTSHTCTLEGRPGIVVPPGGPGPLSVSATVNDPAVPPGFPPQGARFGLRTGQTARVVLWVVRPCDHARGSEARRTLRAFLPFGDAQTTFTIATCRDVGSSMSVGVFAPPEPPARRRTWPLRATLELPGHVTAGRTFSYRVQLTNESRRPFRFPYCPTYAARLNGRDRFGALNCKPMGTLAPGEHATFEMQRFVTAKLPTRRYELLWTLMDETLKDGVAGRGNLRVEH
jgi:hypothetical protein